MKKHLTSSNIIISLIFYNNKNRIGTNFFTKLPETLLHCIIEKLVNRELAFLMMTCKELYNLLKDKVQEPYKGVNDYYDIISLTFNFHVQCDFDDFCHFKNYYLEDRDGNDFILCDSLNFLGRSLSSYFSSEFSYESRSIKIN